MSRKNRIKLGNDGATYHVCTRTVQQQFLFSSHKFREWIYRRILALTKVYYIDLHSLAVMSNHYHMVFSIKKPKADPADIEKRFGLLQSLNRRPRGWHLSHETWYERFTDLSEFVKAVNESIAREFNLKNDTRGHVWGGRFFSTTIEDGPGLLACMAYVELNPVRAGLVKKPSDYPWCTAGRFQKRGAHASGVTLPNLSIFAKIKRRYHQRAFVGLVDQIALHEAGEECQLPITNAEWEKQLAACDTEYLAEWCFRRTRWAVHSLVLGSANFCKRIIQECGLQKAKPGGPRIRPLFNGIHNCKERGGIYAS